MRHLTRVKLEHSRLTDHLPIDEGSLAGGMLITIHRLSHGGADRVAMHLANGFADAGMPVGLAVLRRRGEGEEALLSMLNRSVRVGHAGAPMRSRHLELLRGRRYLRELEASARPQLVLASSNNMGLVTGLAREKGASQPRFAMKFTNPVIRPEDRTAIKKLYRRLLYGMVFSNFDTVLVLSEQERQTLAALYPRQHEKFVVAANPYVEPAMFEGRNSAKNAAVPTILALARLMPQKRLDILLRAFSQLTSAGARLVIIGDGPERTKLETLARQLGVADSVEMPGFVIDPLPWLRSADLLALSSDYEGLPAVVFEAFASNVPVVTTDSFDAARAIVGGRPRCAVVPVGDVTALAGAMDLSLERRGEAIDLTPLAHPYEIDEAISAHLGALLLDTSEA